MNLITFKVEGVESENGHVRADEFLDGLRHLLTALNNIDRLVGETGAPTLYYRIVAASHESPLSVTLEPTLRAEIHGPAEDHIKRRHARFFKELEAIRIGETVSSEVDDQLLEHLRDLSSSETSFKAVTISNGEHKVPLDSEFDANLRKLLDEEIESYGGAEGTLDAVNIHGGAKRFWIYPRIGNRIRCDFLPGTQDLVKEALGHYVRVEGVKYFRAGNQYAHRIHVREFEVLPNEAVVALKDLGGIAPGATGAMDSVEFVRALRDEWD